MGEGGLVLKLSSMLLQVLKTACTFAFKFWAIFFVNCGHFPQIFESEQNPCFGRYLNFPQNLLWKELVYPHVWK